MHTRVSRGIGLIIIVLSLVLYSCGGGTTTTNTDLGGNETPATTAGDVTGAPSASDYPVVTADLGNVFEDAPLGTNADYDVQVAGATVSSHGASKVSSDLAEGAAFQINWIAIANRGEEPVEGEAPDDIAEGSLIDLYISYEVAGGYDLNREWYIDDAGLSLIEDAGTTQAGVYTAVFNYTIPYDTLADGEETKDLTFQAVLAPPRETSAVIIPEMGDGRSLTFTVSATSTTPPIYYPPNTETGHAQMVWEDLIVNSDYDYNDLVASMHATEYRNEENELVEIDLVVKALARGAGYTSDWQFNMEAAFPGARVTAVVDQYYDDGDGDMTNDIRHGNQRIWTSDDGASVPVFAPTKEALPKPPDHSFATNVVAGTTYMEGDYAHVHIMLDQPMAQGTYTPMPYEPELRVQPNGGGVYIIGLWRNPGDPVDSHGRPLGFIVPDTFAWPLECKRIWNCFPGFTDWIEWVNNQNLPEPSPVWYDTTPVTNYFDRTLFK